MDCIQSTPETITEVHQDNQWEKVIVSSTQSPPQDQEHDGQGNSNSGEGKQHRRQIADGVSEQRERRRDHCQKLNKAGHKILDKIQDGPEEVKNRLQSINHPSHHPCQIWNPCQQTGPHGQQRPETRPGPTGM